MGGGCIVDGGSVCGGAVDGGSVGGGAVDGGSVGGGVVDGGLVGGDWKVLGGLVGGCVVDGWVDLGLGGGCIVWVLGWISVLGLFGIWDELCWGYWVFFVVRWWLVEREEGR